VGRGTTNRESRSRGWSEVRKFPAAAEVRGGKGQGRGPPLAAGFNLGRHLPLVGVCFSGCAVHFRDPFFLTEGKRGLSSPSHLWVRILPDFDKSIPGLPISRRAHLGRAFVRRPLALEILEDRTPPVGLFGAVGGLLAPASLAAQSLQRFYLPPKPQGQASTSSGSGASSQPKASTPPKAHAELATGLGGLASLPVSALGELRKGLEAPSFDHPTPKGSPRSEGPPTKDSASQGGGGSGGSSSSHPIGDSPAAPQHHKVPTGNGDPEPALFAQGVASGGGTGKGKAAGDKSQGHGHPPGQGYGKGQAQGHKPGHGHGPKPTQTQENSSAPATKE